MPGESPVVALTKSSIPKNRKSPIAEGEFSGANRTNEIRAEDRCEIVMATARSKLTCLVFTSRRQGDIEPARRQTGFVIETGGVRFKNDDHH